MADYQESPKTTAAAVGVVFGLLYVLSVPPFMISDPDRQRFLRLRDA